MDAFVCFVATLVFLLFFGLFLWRAGNLNGVFFVNRIYNKVPMRGERSRKVLRGVSFLFSLFALMGAIVFFEEGKIWYAVACSFLAGIAIVSFAFNEYYGAYKGAVRRNLFLRME